MEDRRAVRGLVRGVPIELVIEDGTDRSISERADLDSARSGGLHTCDTERSRQAQDAKAGSEALFGVRRVRAESAGCGEGRSGRWSSRRTGDDWTACDREPSCACRCHSIAGAQRSARPWRRSRWCAR